MVNCPVEVHGGAFSVRIDAFRDLEKFKAIYAKGWIENKRGKNDGAVGNTLEDLLEIPENNLPIPNAAEWELKAQRSTTSSLLTMFHTEPSPTAMSIVPNILLPKIRMATLWRRH